MSVCNEDILHYNDLLLKEASAQRNMEALADVFCSAIILIHWLEYFHSHYIKAGSRYGNYSGFHLPWASHRCGTYIFTLVQVGPRKLCKNCHT